MFSQFVRQTQMSDHQSRRAGNMSDLSGSEENEKQKNNINKARK